MLSAQYVIALYWQYFLVLFCCYVAPLLHVPLFCGIPIVLPVFPCSASVPVYCQCTGVPLMFRVPQFRVTVFLVLLGGERWAMKPNDATTTDKFQENARTDGRMDGRTEGWKDERKDGRMDRPYFIGSFWLTLGVQNDFKHQYYCLLASLKSPFYLI